MTGCEFETQLHQLSVGCFYRYAKLTTLPKVHVNLADGHHEYGSPAWIMTVNLQCPVYYSDYV